MEILALIIAVVLLGMAASWFVSARWCGRSSEGSCSGWAGRRSGAQARPDDADPDRRPDAKVNMQVVTMPVPAQEGITRDNVTVRVDAVVYFRVVDPWRAAVIVEDYKFAILQVAQTSLRSIIGKSEMDDLLSNRESSTRASR